jgi:hypothetical protein
MLPLGYDLPETGQRVLRVNEGQADLVRLIFTHYLALGSVHALEHDLAARGIRTRETRRKDGSVRGGGPFSRGALFHLLRNRLYLGEILHKGQSHPGQHQPIIPRDLFEAVQARLDSQARRRSSTPGTRMAASPLAGRIFDADGHPMSPSFTHGKHGTLYRYYVSAPLQQGQRRAPDDPHPRRVPAHMLEETLIQVITGSIASASPSGQVPEQACPLDRIGKLTVCADRLVIALRANGERPDHEAPQPLVVPFRLSIRSGRSEILPGNTVGPRQDRVLIRALRQAHARVRRDASGEPVLEAAPAMVRARRILRLAFLAPDLQRAILDGRQPRHLTLARLIDRDIPLLWSEQRRLLTPDA